MALLQLTVVFAQDRRKSPDEMRRRDGPLRLAAVRRRRGGRREDREGTDQQVQHFCEHTATAMGFSVDGERRPACVLRLKTMLARLHASLKIHS